MKVLYVTYMSLSEPLSYSQVLAYLKGLARRGVSVSILSFEKDKFASKEVVYNIRKILKDANIHWYFLKYHKRPQGVAKPWDMLCGMVASLFIVLKEGIDIVHARNAICAFMVMPAVLFLKRKFIFDIRGFMADEYVDANLWQKKSFVYKFVQWLEKYFTKRADSVVVITQKAREFLTRTYHIKEITVIPTCVDLRRFYDKEKDEPSAIKDCSGGRFTLLYIGSVGTWYMLSEMIHFFRTLLSQLRQEAVFLILSQTEKNIIEKSVPPGLEKDIIIKCVSPDRVADFLPCAHAGIFFIRPCFSKISSCPTKFAEYLASGLPVVINRGIGDTETVVTENNVGVVVKDFNVQEYERAMQALLVLLKEKESLKKRCREVATKYYSLEDGIERYFNVYSGAMR